MLTTLHPIPSTIVIHNARSEGLQLEIIPTQLKFESFVDGKITEDTALSTLHKIKSWLAEEHQFEITLTQAWDLLLAVRHAFELHKKKLSDMLMLPSGSEESIPSPSPETSGSTT
jgi:hypothetical protein